MRLYSSLYIIMVFSAILFSCSEDNNANPNQTGTFTLHFDNVVGDENLVLETGTYLNSNSESFTIHTLKYFVSNIKLKRTDNSEYIIPVNNSYFLLDESDPESLEVMLEDVPVGDYNEVSFIIGVDSLKSVADITQRTGVLDPENSSMYMDFNSGYIFFKMEGTSPTAPDNQFTYRIGGYGGSSSETKTVNNIKTIALSFGSFKATVRNNISPEVHVYVDMLKFFDSDNTVSIEEHPSVLFSDDYAVKIADNYAKMIAFGHVHNEPVEAP